MSFLTIILAAFAYVFENRRVLARALLFPVIVLIILDSIRLMNLGPGALVLLGLIQVVVQVVFAIVVHRVILLGTDAVPVWGVTQWSHRETAYLGHIIGLGFLLLPVFFLIIIPKIGVALVVAGISWLVGRLSLVFPSIAIGQNFSYRRSWELTRDHQGLMLLVVAVVPALLVLPLLLIARFPNTYFVSSVISIFVIVFEVSALSVAYHFIVGNRQENASKVAVDSE